MKRELIPAILSKSAADAKRKFELCDGMVSWVQLDVMDGKFVKNKTWHGAAAVKKWKVKPRIELHLMVNDPLKVMKAWKTIPNFKRALWHVEANVDHRAILDWCAKQKIEGGLALSPNTPLDVATPFIYHKAYRRTLILGVNPGWSGQKLQTGTYRKARALRALRPNLPIAFDGGVKKSNIPTLARNGVTAFSAASSVFNSSDPRQAIKEMKALIRSLS